MLEQSAIIALLVLSIWYTMQDGEIFGFMQKFSHWKIAPALFDCNVCMTPWYGSVLYFLIYKLWLDIASWQNWPIVVICAMGINAVINKLAPKDNVDVVNHY